MEWDLARKKQKNKIKHELPNQLTHFLVLN
jgi:hypothetical protein